MSIEQEASYEVNIRPNIVVKVVHPNLHHDNNYKLCDN